MSPLKALCSRVAVAVVLTVPLLATTRSAPQQSDVVALVAAARKALGGEEALGRITSLAIRGTVVRNHGSMLDWEFDTSYHVPDKFVRISRRTFDRPTRYDMTLIEGFNGSRVILENIAPNAPNRIVVPPREPRDAKEAEVAETTRLHRMHQTFFEAILPLFVTLPSTYGLQLSAAGRESLAQGTADMIELRRSDGMSWLLFLDVASHLPVQLTWKARPSFIVSMPNSSVTLPGMSSSSSSSSVMPPGTGARDPRQAPEVFWVMEIRDYRKADGLTWPRRLTTLSDGKPFSDVRVSRYQINPKIDPQVFEPRK